MKRTPFAGYIYARCYTEHMMVMISFSPYKGQQCPHLADKDSEPGEVTWCVQGYDKLVEVEPTLVAHILVVHSLGPYFV